MGGERSLHGGTAVHIYCFIFSVFELFSRTEDNGDDDNYDDIINKIMNNKTSEASHSF